MSLALAAAEERDPQFAAKARAEILRHLGVVRRASGEDLVEFARAAGVQCKDGRAFGSIFRSLVRSGQIVCLRSDLPRRHGHGTSGGKLYGIV